MASNLSTIPTNTDGTLVSNTTNDTSSLLGTTNTESLFSSLDFTPIFSELSIEVNEKIKDFIVYLKSILRKDSTVDGLIYTVLFFIIFNLVIFLTFIFVFFQFSFLSKIIISIILTILLYQALLILNKIIDNITGRKIFNEKIIKKKINKTLIKIKKKFKIIIIVISIFIYLLINFYIGKIIWNLKHKRLKEDKQISQLLEKKDYYNELNKHNFWNLIIKIFKGWEGGFEKFPLWRILFQDYSTSGKLDDKLIIILEEIGDIKDYLNKMYHSNEIPLADVNLTKKN